MGNAPRFQVRVSVSPTLRLAIRDKRRSGKAAVASIFDAAVLRILVYGAAAYVQSPARGLTFDVRKPASRATGEI